jgi:hypothetical protein
MKASNTTTNNSSLASTVKKGVKIKGATPKFFEENEFKVTQIVRV